MASHTSLPPTHRALVLTSTTQPPEVKIIPTPQPTPGSAIIRITAANVISYSKHIYNGVRSYPLSVPLVIGTSALGRIAALGPDAVNLKEGQLVLIDSFIKGRDDPSVAFLMGVHEGYSEGSKKLMRGEWRDATYAEYAKVPLENCYALNEEVVVGKLGYGIEELQDIARLVVPYGGLKDINLQPGETIIIAPATGAFGSAAVTVALAMGARVIAMGRNLDILQRLSSSHPRISTVPITGNVDADLASLKSFGPIDAYLDISPPQAANSTHFQSCFLALKHGGRVSLMGGLGGDLAIPVRVVVHQDLCIKGKWMFSREDVVDLIKMVEIGVLKPGREVVSKFGLEEWEKAFDIAVEYGGSDKTALIIP